MKTIASLAAIVTVAAAATAFAQPARPPAKPRPAPPAPRPRAPDPGAFATTTRYRECQQTWAFACNIPTGDGGHYGTAEPQTICTTYTFAPDGTYSVAMDVPVPEHGTYRILGTRVILVEQHDDHTTRTYELALSKDRAKLGALSLVR